MLESIVNARVNKALFASPDVLPKFISITGGVIRDLFAMLNDAATAAEYRRSAVISDQQYSIAYNTLKREYNNTIADYLNENGTIKYPAADFYKVMADLVNSAEKKPDNSEILMLLRQNLCVLSYNGEGWCDVHPIMKDVLREKGYLQ